MDPTIIAAIVSAVAPIVSNEIGSAQARGDKQRALDLANEAAAKYRDIVAPKLAELGYKQQADTLLKLSPKEGRNAQMRALEGLGGIVEGEGTDAQMAEANREARAQAGAMAAGLQGGAAQRAAQTGLGGTQSEYVASLIGGQSAVNRGAEMASRAAADANQRRIQALGLLGSQGGALRAGDQREAEAQDAINRFNTSMGNEQLYRGKQGDFLNQMALANAQQRSAADLGNIYRDKAAQTQAEAATTGAAVSSGAQGVGGALQSQQQGLSSAPQRDQMDPFARESEADYWRRMRETRGDEP